MDRLWALEQFVNQLRTALLALTRRVTSAEQALAADAVRSGQQSSGSGGLQPAVLTASLVAGSIGTPATAAGTLLVPSGSGYTTVGGTSITIQSTFATAITVSGSKFCWVTFTNGGWFLVVSDC